MFRLSWTRNGVWEAASSYVTVTASTVSYSTTAPAPGTAVTATVSPDTGLSYQWQWSYGGYWWGEAGESDANTKTLTVPNKPGVKFRATWTRNGVREYAPSYITVTKETATYSTSTPAPGKKVSVALGGGATGVTYQWQWSYDGNAWMRAGESDANTKDITVPNKPGVKFRAAWTRNGVWSAADTHVTVTDTSVFYSSSTPLPLGSVTATLGDTTDVSSYQWQWSFGDGTVWQNAGETGSTTTTLILPAKPGFMFRISWVRNGVYDYAKSRVTVTQSAAPSVSYNDTTPAQGSQVTATLTGNTTGITSYQWQWSYDGSRWGDAGESGNKTTTLTMPNKSGVKFRISWTRNGVWEPATTYVSLD